MNTGVPRPAPTGTIGSMCTTLPLGTVVMFFSVQTAMSAGNPSTLVAGFSTYEYAPVVKFLQAYP